MAVKSPLQIRSVVQLTPAEKQRIQKIWHALIPTTTNGKFRSVFSIPGFRSSLRSLAKQGYTLMDIGTMFGVSRERVRQWLAALGVKASDLRSGLYRIWDERRYCFFAVPRSKIHYPCACGCGFPAQYNTKYIAGHGHGWQLGPRTEAFKRHLSQHAKQRWAAYSEDRRAEIGRAISRGHQRRKHARLGR